MQKNSKTTIPENMTIEEASEFWDEFSLFDFDGTREIEVEFKLKRKHYVGIDRKLFEQVKDFAQQQNTTPEALLAAWIVEKIA